MQALNAAFNEFPLLFSLRSLMILAIFILLLGILVVYSWIRLTHGQARINTTLAEYGKAKQKAAQAASPMPQA
jgi:hypothetical protein